MSEPASEPTGRSEPASEPTGRSEPASEPTGRSEPASGSVSGRASGAPEGEAPDDTAADRIASAVTAIPSVASLGGGLATQVATFLPGRRVTGVRLGDEAVEVHVTARYGASLPDLGEEVRTAAEPFAGGLPVEVYVDDLEVPGLDEPTAPAGELPAVATTPLPPSRP